MRKLLILLLCLALMPTALLAQDTDAEEGVEDAAYLRLNSNFSVPELGGAWEQTIEGETVLFTREDVSAQIYVRIVDTMDYTEAIATAIGDLDAVTETLDAPIYEGRIGRTDGTWNYQLFNVGDTSVTAYAMLQSNQHYVVVFAEESADYDAYHLAIRGNNPSPEDDQAVTEVINPAAQTAIQSAFDADFSGEPLSTRNPVEDNPVWIEATYDNNLTTASYLYEGIVYVTMIEGATDLAPSLSNAFDIVFLGFVITPDNTEYLYLGLAISATIMLMLIGSMYLRYQNLKKDMATIEALAEDEN